MILKYLFHSYFPFYLKLAILIIPLLFFSGTTLTVMAQEDDEVCRAAVQEALQVVGSACREMGRNEACYGHTLVAATFNEDAGTITFESNGDTADLVNLAAMTTEPMDPTTGDWGIALLKLQADLPESSDSALTLVLLGDTEVTNATVTTAETPVCELSNGASTINMYAGPSTNREIVGVMPATASGIASGRDASGDWLRIERNRRLGWIEAASVTLTCEASNVLPEVSDEDMSDVYNTPLQAFTISNAGGGNCAEAPDGLLIHSPEGERARVQVNGVQLDLGSAGFVNAVQDGDLTITGLEGEIEVYSDGVLVQVDPGFYTTVPLAGLQADGPPAEPRRVSTGNLPFLLNEIAFDGATLRPGIATSADSQVVGEPTLVEVSFVANASRCPIVTPPLPLDIVLVIDQSGSMEGERLASAKGAAANFIERLDPLTDRVSVVTFDDVGYVIQSFTSDFDAALGAIGGIASQGGTAIDQGLLTGYSQFTSDEARSAERVLILLSDGASNPAAAEAAAAQVRNDGIELVSVAVGSGADTSLLNSISSQGSNFFQAANVGLQSLFNNLVLGLTQPIAAQDLEITYRYDPALLEVVEGEFFAGEVVEPGVVRWSLAEVRNSQAVTLPLLLRPLVAGEIAVGTAEITYTACDSTTDAATVAVSGRALLVVEEATNGDQTTTQADGFLPSGFTGESRLTGFETEGWIVDVPDDATFGVLVGGAGNDLEPQVAVADGEVVAPLFTLKNYQGEDQSLSIFSVEDIDLTWLYVQSNGQTDAGDYTVRFEDDQALVPTGTLRPDGAVFRSSQADFNGEAYALEGVQEGDIVTLRYVPETASDVYQSYPYVVSLDGTYANNLHSYAIYERAAVSLQQIRGAGPYYVVLTSDTDYQVSVDAGDTLREPQGNLALGDSREITLNRDFEDGDAVHLFTLDGEEGDRFTVIVDNTRSYPYLLVRNAEGEVLFNATSSDETYAYDDITLEGPGPYQLTVEALSSYRVRVVEYGSLETEGNPLVLDEPLRGQGSTNAFLVNHPLTETSVLDSTALITVTLSSREAAPAFQSDGTEAISVNLLDAEGNQIISNYDIDPYSASDNSVFETGGVYTLNGNAPYQIQVVGAGLAYDLLVEAGDTLRAPAIPVAIGQRAAVRQSGGEVQRFTLVDSENNPLPTGSEIAVVFDSFGSYPSIESGSGSTLYPDFSVYNSSSGGEIYFFTLNGVSPFTLTLDVYADFGVTIVPRDEAVTQAGTVSLNGEISGSTQSEQAVAVLLEANDATVTLEIAMDTFSYLSPQVYDATGRSLSSLATVNNDGQTTLGIYELNGTSPYTVYFSVTGGYTVRLREGNALIVDRGTLSFDNPLDEDFLRNEQILNYQLAVGEGELFSIVLSHLPYIYPEITMRDADGSTLSPVETQEGDELTIHVYRRTASETYGLTVSLSGSYSVVLVENDALRFDKGFIIPGDTVQGNLALVGEVTTWQLEAERGETVSVELITAGNTLPTAPTLTDKNGDVLTSETQLAAPGYVVDVYTLTGEAPYTLSFTAQGDYTLNVPRGDATILPMGEAVLVEPIRGRVTEVIKEVQYTLTPTDTGLYSFQVALRGRDQVASLILMDASGEPIAPEVSTQTSDQLGAVGVYNLSAGETYTIGFSILGDYTLTVTSGDIVRVDLGELPMTTRTRNTLRLPAEVGIYNLPTASGETITLETQDLRSNALLPIVTDASGTVLTPGLQVTTSRNVVFSVYTLAGTAPFKVALATPNGYQVTVNTGNTVIEDKGIALPGEAITGRMTAPALIAAYTLEGGDGDLITLQLTPNGGRNALMPQLVNAGGEVLEPVDQVITDRAELIALYMLAGEDPYTLSFFTETPYTLTVSDGDLLRTERAAVFGEPVSDELVAPTYIARYPLDNAAGELITLELTGRAGLILPDLINANGEVVAPRVLIEERNKALVVYELSAATPHVLEVQTRGRYDITFLAGDAIRVDQGTAVIGETITGQLTAPGRVAVYTLDLAPGTYLSIQGDSRGALLEPTVTDAAENVLLPLGQVRVTGGTATIYRLLGEAPFQLAFTPNVTYNLTLTEGDLRHVPQEVTLTEGVQLSGQARDGFLNVYPLDVATGEDLDIVLTSNQASILDVQIMDSRGEIVSQPLPLDAQGAPARVREGRYQLVADGEAPFRLLVRANGTYQMTVLAEVDRSNGFTIIVERFDVNLRDAPDRNNSNVLLQAYSGQEFRAVGRNGGRGDWILLLDEADNQYWVLGSLITIPSADNTFESLPIVYP